MPRTFRYLLPTALLFCLFSGIAQAGQEKQASAEPSWQIAVKQKTLFNSHTSYEFGNPLPPYQQPLSRLEFPVDSVWGGVEIRKQISRVSIGAGFLTTFTAQETGRFKDSDWDDDTNTVRLTNYGETYCRLNPSYQVEADIDLQLADLLHLPHGFDLRPVAGFRWQQLSLMAHDGLQYDYDTPGLPPVIQDLPGDTIGFEQNWYQYFLGVRLGYEWQRLPWLHHLKLQSQLDWSSVAGDNRDYHLLRPGHRITEEQTSGNGWHASLAVLLGITRNVDLGVEADYLKLETTGTHTLRYDFSPVENWSTGVKVWSEQYGITMKTQFRF